MLGLCICKKKTLDTNRFLCKTDFVLGKNTINNKTTKGKNNGKRK